MLREAKQAIKNRTLGYVLAGLGLVGGLAWNDAIRSLIDYFLPASTVNTVVAKFIYAMALTIVVAVLLNYLEKFSGTGGQTQK